MKQVPKPMKKPTTPAEAAAAKKSVASKVEAGDNKLMKYKKGGKVKCMKKGGKVKAC